MAVSLQDQLVVAISSRALFDFEAENRVFDEDPAAYVRLQRERLDVPAAPGVALPLVRKLLAFNQGGQRRVEVVLLSRNDPVSGMRVFRSAKAHGLDSIQRGVFTQGRDPYAYLRPLGADLFLSANAADVTEALNLGYLFSDEAERVYQRDGLAAFMQHEVEHVTQPLPDGPFKPLLVALHRLQQAVQDGDTGGMRLRTALVTARSAPAHERAIRTLMDWQIEVDEAMFLGGLPKGEFLREFAPDFFFDDQTGHVQSASAHVPAGHVRSGIANI